ncbi:MAG: NUDIX hydrolase [Desulfobacterota bacterium]|nr:NUDIX hydrolase [Thermodesulfobacteriota bacterium]
MLREWEILDSYMASDFKIFKVGVQNALCPRTGKVSQFYTIHTPPWVNVIPLTEDRKVVMIRQFRFGSQSFCLEIPGGLVDNETPEEAAKRELLEETGYSGDYVEFLGSVNPNPALFDNECSTFLVKNVKEVGKKNLDPNEDIEVVLVPLKDIPQLIMKGTINHALVVAAFCFYFLKYPENA